MNDMDKQLRRLPSVDLELPTDIFVPLQRVWTLDWGDLQVSSTA